MLAHHTHTHARHARASADDVSLKFAGSAPGLPYLTVENFFCENALKQLVDHAAEDQRLFTDTQASYPGKALRINKWIKKTKRRGGLVRDRLSKNEHLQCLRRALLIARERDDWTEEEEEALQILEKGESYRKSIEKANSDDTGRKTRKLQAKV